MRTVSFGLSTMLLASFAAAPRNDPPPASRTIAANCAAIASVALAEFRKGGFDAAPSPSCPDCYTLKTVHLHDPDGHAISNVRSAIHRYMTVGKESDIFGAWYIHSGLKASGDLRLAGEQTGCRVQLLFHYSWYATEVLIVVPVDGDPASRPSSLKLENEYLDRIARDF